MRVRPLHFGRISLESRRGKMRQGNRENDRRPATGRCSMMLFLTAKEPQQRLLR
jgi:hypothetical protein